MGRGYPNEYLSEEERKGIDEQEKRMVLARQRIAQIINTEGFEELIKIILDFSNFNGNNYGEGEGDFAYKEGRRSIFHDLLGTLEEIDPEFYPKLLLKMAGELKDERARNNDTDN